MLRSLQETFGKDYEALSKRLDRPLRVIAKQSVTVWFNRDRLDKLFAGYIGVLEDCELMYAIDADGRQVSSNVHARSIDTGAYGQDLSDRPYAVSLAVLNNVATHGAFMCNAYISKATRRPCVTVMHGVTSRSTLLGFIATDFYRDTE